MGLLAQLFGRRAAKETPQQRERRERSQAQIEAGGLPVAAEERLRALTPGFFTSDLSVNAFTLLHKEGIEPITQVMGSSVFRHPGHANVFRSVGAGGWSNSGRGGGSSHHIVHATLLSDAFNQARRRALDRLLKEAELAGADAVVGVRVIAPDDAWGSGTMNEFAAFGTAVRLPPALRSGRCVLTDLSVQDYWKLAQAGYHPRGIVAVATAVYVNASWNQNQVMGSRFWNSSAYRNQELGEFTEGYHAARHKAEGEVADQAEQLGAHGVVGVTFSQHLHEHEWEDSGDNKRHDLLITMHMIGTAITQDHEPIRPTNPLTIVPLRKGDPVA
jgi:uncharacterized protein YbjQ (UPF0145 family)